MDPNKVIDQINEDIMGVISNFIELKKSGASFTACCPFYNEKHLLLVLIRQKEFLNALDVEKEVMPLSLSRNTKVLTLKKALR